MKLYKWPLTIEQLLVQINTPTLDDTPRVSALPPNGVTFVGAGAE